MSDQSALSAAFDRALAGSCAGDARLTGADVDGEHIEVALNGAVPDALRKAAAAALESKGSVRIKVQAFGGWVSKPQRHTPEFLESVAASGAGAPIMGREHEGWTKPPVEGVVEGASYDAGGHAIMADVALHGEQALRELSWGVMPRFSINPAPTATTKALCSHCSEPMTYRHAWQSDHYPGRVLDGKRVEIVWTGQGRLAEITRTYSPAAGETGITAAALTAERLDDFAIVRALALAEQQEKAMSGEKEETKPAAQATTESPEAARVRQLEAKLAEREAKDAERDAQLKSLQAAHDRQLDQAITEAILMGARAGKLHKLANTEKADDPNSGLNQERALAKAMGLDAYKAHLDRIPSNPALAAGIKTPAPGQSPGEIEQQSSHQALADKMGEIARANPTASADDVARMAYSALAAEGRPVTLH